MLLGLFRIVSVGWEAQAVLKWMLEAFEAHDKEEKAWDKVENEIYESLSESADDHFDATGERINVYDYGEDSNIPPYFNPRLVAMCKHGDSHSKGVPSYHAPGQPRWRRPQRVRDKAPFRPFLR